MFCVTGGLPAGDGSSCFVLQVGFLQETVRRECEERFELTEALSVAKEELLALKKPIGGLFLVCARHPPLRTH